MSYTRFKQSVRHAAAGLAYVVVREANFRLQLIAGGVVLLVSVLLPLRKGEIIVICLLILLVLILELLNSALEHFLDIVKPRLHYQVAVVKDIMAAMVLVASIGAASIGVIIFWPYLIGLLS